MSHDKFHDHNGKALSTSQHAQYVSARVHILLRLVFRGEF